MPSRRRTALIYLISEHNSDREIMMMSDFFRKILGMSPERQPETREDAANIPQTHSQDTQTAADYEEWSAQWVACRLRDEYDIHSACTGFGGGEFNRRLLRSLDAQRAAKAQDSDDSDTPDDIADKKL